MCIYTHKPHVPVERHLEAAAEGRAVDGGDDGLPRRADLLEGRVALQAHCRWEGVCTYSDGYIRQELVGPVSPRIYPSSIAPYQSPLTHTPLSHPSTIRQPIHNPTPPTHRP